MLIHFQRRRPSASRRPLRWARPRFPECPAGRSGAATATAAGDLARRVLTVRPWHTAEALIVPLPSCHLLRRIPTEQHAHVGAVHPAHRYTSAHISFQPTNDTRPPGPNKALAPRHSEHAQSPTQGHLHTNSTSQTPRGAQRSYPAAFILLAKLVNTSHSTHISALLTHAHTTHHEKKLRESLIPTHGDLTHIHTM